MDGTSWPFFEDSRRLKDLGLHLWSERDENGHYYIKFISRQKSHRDSSDMPDLTVLVRRVMENINEPLEFSEREALGLVRLKTPEPYDLNDGTKIDEDIDSDEGTVIKEDSDIEEPLRDP